MTTIITHQVNQEDDVSHCAHPGCTCQVEPGQTYCSSECEAQADDEICSCGHENCKPEVIDDSEAEI